MFDRLNTAATEMQAALAELEPDSLIGTQSAVGLQLLSRHERVVAAARLRLTARAERMHPWPREGYRCFEDWLAAKEGTSHGQARRKARTARQLRDRDRTADALADGEISEDEADVIADAADKNPQAERDLLDAARNRAMSHDDLKKKAADAKAAGEDDQTRADRLRRGRRAGWGTDREGFWTLHGRFEPHVGAEIKARLAAEVDRIFTTARRAGTREPHDRHRADAVANLIRGRDTAPAATAGVGNDQARPGTTEDQAAHDAGEPNENDQLDLDLDRATTTTSADRSDQARTAPTAAAGRDRAPSTGRFGRELVIDINLQTLRRGLVLSGETCTIRGVGPVPVEIARQWADDAFIKAVIRDGTDIKTVAHYGRHIPTHLRTALGLIETTCSVPGCSNPRTDYDHNHRHADGGACSTTNLRPLCVRHHRQRTHHGYELHGEPDNRRWLDPNGKVLFADNPHHLTANTDPAP